VNETASLLSHVEILSGLDEGELERLIRELHVRDYPAGSLIFGEGDEGSELFIVGSGKVSVSVRLRSGGEQEIAEFRPGDFFGEMSIFEDAPRSGSCRTKQNCRLFTLHKGDFRRLADEHPSICIKLMHRMLNITTWRLRNTSEFVSDMVEWGEDARRRAVTDELTGVYNRRFLDEALDGYFESAREAGRPLSLVMIDLDRFREINERHGQKEGDRVIAGAVSAFKRVLRETDVIARYGGDEFTVILPDTGLEAAREIAERMRREVGGFDSDGARVYEPPGSEPAVRVTTSQGVASYPACGADAKTIKEKADGALYRAKEGGRNRVVCADSAPV
jgi:diguanylate cyclase (GGDEF)-like protein